MQVSFEEHKQELLKAYNKYQNSQGAEGNGATASISAAINAAQLESLYQEDSISPLAAMTAGYSEAQTGDRQVAETQEVEGRAAEGEEDKR